MTVIFHREGGRWLAQSVSPEVATFGETLDEARIAIREALEPYFDDDPEPPSVNEVRVETVLG